jgi:DNA-binding CsgD family transcriptional regulator
MKIDRQLVLPVVEQAAQRHLVEEVAAPQLALQDRGTAFSGFGTDSRQGSVHKASIGHGLTRREREVLREVRHGRTSREIAELLGVSIPTINKHVQKVLQKLDVRNRVQAIARLDAESAARGCRDFDAGS